MRRLFLTVIISLFACFQIYAGTFEDSQSEFYQNLGKKQQSQKTEKTDAYGRTKLYNAASYEEADKLIKGGSDMRHKDCAGLEPIQSTMFYSATGPYDYCKGRTAGMTSRSPGEDKIGLAKALADNGVFNNYTHEEKVNLMFSALVSKAQYLDGNQPAELIIASLGSGILSEAINLPDKVGETVLHKAAKSSNISAAEKFLEFGADVCVHVNYEIDGVAGLVSSASIHSVENKDKKYCVSDSYLVKKFMGLMQQKGCFTEADAADVKKIKKACPEQWAD